MAPLRTRACGLLLLAGCSGGDPTATDPRLLFEDAFDNFPSEVEVVAEGGTMVRGLDGWLKLRPGITALKPRQMESYRYRDCAEPLAWFANTNGEAGLASRQGGVVCQEWIDPRFQFDNGRWLVTDRSSGLVYYRIWKHF